ncbi:MAG TPA: GNAT family N-acetyltransferase [Amycolatopsis sp.]|nr:GNAT family N-acetyltransferase [Amycolatopsis sp.]
MTGSLQVALRQSSARDREYCYQLHRGVLREYVEQIWGWDDDRQRALYEHGFEPARTQIITVDGADAGVLCVDESGDEVFLGLIELHPNYQGQGIGAHIVGTLLAEAESRGRSITLEVLDVNQRAKAFYERLGFRKVGRPREHKIRMRSG